MKIYDDGFRPYSEDEIIERVEIQCTEVRCYNCGVVMKVPLDTISNATAKHLRYELDYINAEIKAIRGIIDNSEIPYYTRQLLIKKIKEISKGNRFKIIK